MLYVLVVTVDVFGGVTFTSEPMTKDWVDLMLIEIARGPFVILKARVVPKPEAAT